MQLPNHVLMVTFAPGESRLVLVFDAAVILLGPLASCSNLWRTDTISCEYPFTEEAQLPRAKELVRQAFTVPHKYWPYLVKLATTVLGQAILLLCHAIRDPTAHYQARATVTCVKLVSNVLGLEGQHLR